MAKFESSIKQVPYPQTAVYGMVSNLENIEKVRSRIPEDKMKDMTFTADEVISFGTHQLQILRTPGHTPGGVTFYCAQEKAAFTGDTLFRMSIGRTDFERGSYEDILKSLGKVLAQLPADTTVYPGHGPVTTISDELSYNPYLKA